MPRAMRSCATCRRRASRRRAGRIRRTRITCSSGSCDSPSPPALGERETPSLARREGARALGEARDLARLAGELEYVHTGIGAVDDIDVAAIVDLDIVRLDRDLAALLAALDLDA